MRYPATIILCSALFVVNGVHVALQSEVTLKNILVFVLNLIIIGILGRKIDHYLIQKKELGTTKVDLLQYSYGLNSTMDGVGITNESGQFEYVNHSHVKMYGYSKEEMLRSHWSLCYSEKTIEILKRTAIPALTREGYWRGEAEGVRKDGTTFPQEIVLSRIKESKKVFCVVRDITEQKRAEEKIKELALTNELTNLPNRRSLVHQLDVMMKDPVRCYLLFIDLDRFKNVNDALGHEVGDQLLVHVAERLGTFKEQGASVFHTGGDEYILLLQVEESKVVQVASKLVEEMNKPFHVSEIEINISVSVGISCYPDDHDELEGLISLADTAMYYAKMSGRNGYKFVDNDMKAALDRRFYLEAQLKKAILYQQLSLHFQPLVDLKTAEIVGAEALLRWNLPKIGAVSPAEFIPIAEETGVINDIGRWVIREAVSQASLWRKDGHAITMSVNVSRRQLSNDRTLPAFIRNTLEAFQLDPGRLELEITESVMENYQIIVPVLNELKSLGVQIALDDFGTGFSSLAFLKKMPIDSLKIDQTFVKELTSNQVDVSIVKSIIELGINLNLNTVAEGIETSEHLQILKDMKCSHGQGYYLGKPLPAEEMAQIMSSQHVLGTTINRRDTHRRPHAGSGR